MTVPGALVPANTRKYNDLAELVKDLAPYLGGSKRGVVDRPQRVVNAADLTLTNATITAATAPHPSTADVITVEAASLYEFDFFYHLVTGATTHTTSFGLTLVTATLVSIRGWIEGASMADDTLAPWQAKPLVQATATAATATSTAVNTLLRGRGVLRTTLGGTISPFVLMSADPTGTLLSKTGSFFKLTKLGTNTDVNIGANAA